MAARDPETRRKGVPTGLHFRAKINLLLKSKIEAPLVRNHSFSGPEPFQIGAKIDEKTDPSIASLKRRLFWRSRPLRRDMRCPKGAERPPKGLPRGSQKRSKIDEKRGLAAPGLLGGGLGVSGALLLTLWVDFSTCLTYFQ